ncbi:unnamed protein product [Linum tenue]|uniref:GATA transcription factor n=1 Tax=Linum tenue TaxID=586396 RepID=A0AAV0K6R4_9ROSI|nr:unnamed protein product [Linum tenue]
MGKEGPCYHCGVTSTPLWRNGPPEKPVLCNACGSRWRTKGTLANYTPLHSRADPDEYEDQRVARLKNISLNRNKEIKLVKRKPNLDAGVVGGMASDYVQSSRKVMDEDFSNRSSSGSAISNSESCAHFGSMDASELTGPSQTVVWDSMVPSRKRTCVNRPKQSPVEKLTKDLYTILHEQQSSCFSGTSEDDLLFESETPMVSVEIGHGSVLIRHPSAIARDEESEASSLSIENKFYPANEAYSHSVNFSNAYNGNTKCIKTLDPVIEKPQYFPGQGMPQQEQLNRDKSQNEKVQILGHHNSPLCNIDLNCVLNFKEFSEHLTSEEQQQLLKFLPALDTGKLPDSIRSMFDSPQFKENLSSYQQLLTEGVFDLSLSGVKTEDCKTLKRLTLCNPSKSKWVEHYHLLKKCKNNRGKCPPTVKGLNVASNFSTTGKRPQVKMMSPRRSSTKTGYENNSREIMDNDASCFSPKSLFALPPEGGGSFVLDSLHFVDESSDQDLLLDVPSNGSFPQAELLHPAMSFGGQQASTSSSSVYPHHRLQNHP